MIEESMKLRNELVQQKKEASKDIREQISALTEQLLLAEMPFLDKIEEIEDSIRQEVLAGEKSVKTEYGSCTFRKAYVRKSWDTKKLEGMGVLIPEIMECQNVSEVNATVIMKFKDE